MKANTRWTTVLATASAVALLAGCAYVRKEEAKDTEALLAAAGFHMKLADTPVKLTKLANFPPRQIVTRKHTDGVVYYAYADPDYCKCLYVGTETQYQRYQQLALQKELAREQVEAAQMNEDAAADWGFWGPFGPW